MTFKMVQEAELIISLFQQLDGPPAHKDTSPPMKRKPCPQRSSLGSEDSIEANTAGTCDV